MNRGVIGAAVCGYFLRSVSFSQGAKHGLRGVTTWTAAQHSDMAEIYIKRWEPEEDFHDIPGHVIDALCEAFESEEERRQAVWFDDRNFYEFFPLQAVYTLRKAC